jgi:hypothetical protein
MKLDSITSEHINHAALIIDEQGIPKDSVWSQYYVVVDEKEYPFKHLVRTAYILATGEKPDFQSNESYRGYIENTLGFVISYYKGGYNFFTKEELDFYVSIHYADYRKDNPEQAHYANKLYPINQKLKYWLEQIKPEGYSIRFDGKWLGINSKVSPYLWPRLYKGEDKDIFFNVEVAAYEKFIGIKLDGYYSTTKKLSEDKIKLLDDFKKNPNNKWDWLKIPFNKVHLYDWERLISESKQYITNQSNNFDTLRKLLTKESKISRITWNTQGWVKPSGRTGKSQNPSFENKNGFGHEEWLFDGDKVIAGYKYGFLEPINKFISKYEGRIFDISLYTRDCDTNHSYWVTTLKNVEVLTKEESAKILQQYIDDGWYDEMKNDLENLNLDADQLDLWIQGHSLFNIKFTANQLSHIPTELIKITDANDIPSNRYTLMDDTGAIESKYNELEKTGFSFEDSGSTEGDLAQTGKRKPGGKEIELELKHNLIQQKFLFYLQNKYGKDNVKRECKAHGASRIDITQKTETGFIFYEIKTYNSLRTSIRESIGQLLEYCFYPNVQAAEKLILVSHVAPTEELNTYFTHIKQQINIPLSYIHFDIDSEEIISEI